MVILCRWSGHPHLWLCKMLSECANCCAPCGTGRRCRHGRYLGEPRFRPVHRARRRPLPGQGNGRCRLRRRQRQAGGPLLLDGVRHEAGRLLGPGERQPRERELRPHQRRGPFRLHLRHQGIHRPGPLPRGPCRRARRRCGRPGHRGAGRPRRVRLRHRERRHRPPGAVRAEGRARHRRTRRHRHVRQDPPHPGRALRLRRPVPARVRRRRTDGRRPAQAHLPGDRPLRGQRRTRQDERVGRLLQQGHGLHEHEGVRGRRHRHRVLRPHVEGRGGRHPQGEVPDQRAA